MIAWDAPGPYAVAFTTREGGVSEGSFASLNLGSRGDDPAHVAENRARAARALGHPADVLVTCFQIHSATPVVASAPFAGGRPRGDAVVTATAGLPRKSINAGCDATS